MPNRSTPTPSGPDPPDPKRQRRRRLQHLREQLQVQRSAWSRWLARLKRAFTTTMKIDRRLTRLQRQIAELTQAK